MLNFCRPRCRDVVHDLPLSYSSKCRIGIDSKKLDCINLCCVIPYNQNFYSLVDVYQDE